MIGEEIRQFKSGPRDLRKFGLTVGGVFIVLGLCFLYRHKQHYPYFLYPGLLLFVFGLTLPKALRTLYIGWMTLAFVLGFIVSTVLLVVFFFVVVTPIALLARCFGKDFLERKWDSKAASYWLPRERSKRVEPAEYERQF